MHLSVCFQLSSLALYLRSPAIVWLSNLEFSTLFLSLLLYLSLWKVFLPTPLPSSLHFCLCVHHVSDVMKYTLFPNLSVLYSAFCVYLSLATRLDLILSFISICPPSSPSLNLGFLPHT